jgi:tetratricopeptide (TPR) repeat protein
VKLTHQISLLVGITFLIYFTSLFNQFVWDDEQFIYKNQYVINFDLPKIFTTNTIAGAGQMSDYYRPLTTASFAVDHLIWKLLPFGYHLTNISLHLAAGIMLLLWLRELGLKKPALLIAFIFLLHPLQTESVTYINSRGDSLYALFSLLSIYLLTKVLKNQSIRLKFNQHSLQLTEVSLLIISTVVYAFSILAKEIGLMTFGLQTLLIIFFHLLQRKNLFNHIKLGIFWLANLGVAICYVAIRATWLNFHNTFNLYQNDSPYATNLLIRLLTFSKTLWVYFKLIIFPYPLYMDRSIDLVTNFNSVWPWLTALLVIIISTLAVIEILKKESAWIFLGAGWFLISLSPVSGIVPINGLIYEHWLYFPIIGFLILIYGCWNLFSLPVHKLVTYFLISLISIYSILTIRQNWIWRSPISLYEYLLQHTNTARIHNNLAMAYSDEKNYELAIYHYQQAIKLADIYPQTHHNLGQLYADMGNLAAAEQEYQQAIKLSPQFYFSYLPLINIYVKEKKYDQAQKLIDELILVNPGNTKLLQLKKEIQVLAL